MSHRISAVTRKIYTENHRTNMKNSSKSKNEKIPQWRRFPCSWWQKSPSMIKLLVLHLMIMKVLVLMDGSDMDSSSSSSSSVKIMIVQVLVQTWMRVFNLVVIMVQGLNILLICSHNIGLESRCSHNIGLQSVQCISLRSTPNFSQIITL